MLRSHAFRIFIAWRIDPITSILPTTDAQTLLVATLDSHVRLLDLTTGKMLNTFSAHGFISKDYRVRACFGAGEASIMCGDEGGKVWEWDLVDVCHNCYFLSFVAVLKSCYVGNCATAEPSAYGPRKSDHMD